MPGLRAVAAAASSTNPKRGTPNALQTVEQLWVVVDFFGEFSCRHPEVACASEHTWVRDVDQRHREGSEAGNPERLVAVASGEHSVALGATGIEESGGNARTGPPHPVDLEVTLVLRGALCVDRH
jgi:hypothetical protein